ncbi:hypothetical protein HZS_6692 [Henneguya salminicola]|nr:hypothetical protein HZS_6692 [Henneguya salminicola]
MLFSDDSDIQSCILISNSYTNYFYVSSIVFLFVTSILCVILPLVISINIIAKQRYNFMCFIFLFYAIMQIFTWLLVSPSFIISSLLGEWILGEHFCEKVSIAIINNFILTFILDLTYLCFINFKYPMESNKNRPACFNYIILTFGLLIGTIIIGSMILWIFIKKMINLTTKYHESFMSSRILCLVVSHPDSYLPLIQ